MDVGGVEGGADGGLVGGVDGGATGGFAGGAVGVFSGVAASCCCSETGVAGGKGGGVAATSTSSAGLVLLCVTCFENASRSVVAAISSCLLTGSGALGSACDGVGADSKGSVDCCHGGIRGASSCSVSIGALPTVIAVAPPAEFSPKYEVILILDESIIPRSSTLPKSPRSVVKASVNIPVPMALL